MAPGTEDAEERRMRDAKMWVSHGWLEKEIVGKIDNRIESSDLGQTRVKTLFLQGRNESDRTICRVIFFSFFFSIMKGDRFCS